MRKLNISGNWKLNKTLAETKALLAVLKSELAGVKKTEIVVCPTYVSLATSAEMLIDSNIKLGAQNLFWEESGAFTGEVSGLQLKAIGCNYVIIGHSERRQYFGETDETVNKRLKSALQNELLPIVCVGETLEEREIGKTFDIISEQVQGALSGISKDEMQKITLAYEPVWAIGTGKTATPEQAQEVHAFIREKLTKLFGNSVAENVTIQYGGSVKPSNAYELLSQNDIDGALVGGASLDVESFAAIVQAAENIEG
ncbi:MAG: triose-phosphate isomerase [Deferribacteres bacterium]|nr:triose-phosphate isomerase [candidate division KSB1 bacterium]MCB9500773.1 triose-phosphate isomerase [Deferribacteres bacterium]